MSARIQRIPSDYRESVIGIFHDAIIELDAQQDPDECTTVMFCAVFAFSSLLKSAVYPRLRLRTTLASLWPKLSSRLSTILYTRTRKGLEALKCLPILRTINLTLDVMFLCIVDTSDFLSNTSVLESLIKIWILKSSRTVVLRQLGGILSRGRWNSDSRYLSTVKASITMGVNIDTVVRLATARISHARRKLATCRENGRGQDIEQITTLLSVNLRTLASLFVASQDDVLVVEPCIALLQNNGIRE